MNVIILSAGQGKRMKSSRPKVLHEMLGQPLLFYVLKTVKSISRDGVYIIVGAGAMEIKHWTQGIFPSEPIHFVTQKQQRGTGHAVTQIAPYQKNLSENILVMCGDTPLLTPQTLKNVMRLHAAKNAHCTVLTALSNNPFGYGRIIRDHLGQVMKIVEQADASTEEAATREINSGTYCFRRDALFANLQEIKPKNKQNEFYLTDVVECMLRKGMKVEAYSVSDEGEILGINSRADLAVATSSIKERVLHNLMLSGVTLIDPSATTVDYNVKIGHNSIIYPYCVLEGNVRIGENCRIGPSCTIRNSVIGNNAAVLHSVLTKCVVKEGARIGPFAHLRPGAVIGKKVRVGNFVEIKNSVVGDETTCAHLTYLGDAHIGKHVNVGAGTITCNYDGLKKHKTIIEDNVFIGSNTILVAPVKIGRGAYTAAGSVITKEVPSFALGVGRSRQENIEGWAKKRSLTRRKNKQK